VVVVDRGFDGFDLGQTPVRVGAFHASIDGVLVVDSVLAVMVYPTLLSRRDGPHCFLNLHSWLVRFSAFVGVVAGETPG
jgi:hypothetical protein